MPTLPNVLIIMLLYSLVTIVGLWCPVVLSLPVSRPLNEQNQDIAWEAWLLVDDQQDGESSSRRTNGADGTPKRSLFVAPPFSLDKYPPCGKDFTADANGRCVRIYHLDQDQHLEHLLQNVFGDLESSGFALTQEEIEDNSEPTRLDIPIVVGREEEDYDDESSGRGPDMTIIVTPVNRNSPKMDKREEDGLEEELKSVVKSTTAQNAEEETTLTTTTEEMMQDASGDVSTLPPWTGLQDTTSSGDIIETTDTTTLPETTTLEETTATTDLPTTTTEAAETASPSIPSTPKITTYHPTATTYHPTIDLPIFTRSRRKNLIKFPVEDDVAKRSHADGNYVRFPDVDYKYQQEGVAHHTRDVDRVHTRNFDNEIMTPAPSLRMYDQLKGASLFDRPEPENYHRRYQTTATTTTERLISRNFPSQWAGFDRSQPPYKPIVIRLSKKRFNVDALDKFKNGKFYRSLPMDDLRYFFGHKNGQQPLRHR